MAIVKMKRVTFLTLAAEGEALLRLIQRLGVLHPEHVTEAEEVPSISQLEHRLGMQSQIIRDLEAIVTPELAQGDADEPPSFESIEGWIGDYKSFTERMGSLAREIAALVPWGEFDPADIESLAKGGTIVQLWSVPRESFEALAIPAGTVARVIAPGRTVHFATVTLGEGVKLTGADEVQPPSAALTKFEAKRAEFAQKRDLVLAELAKAKAHIDELKGQRERSQQEYDFQMASERAFKDESVMAFEGWVPASGVELIASEVARFQAPVVMDTRDPAPDETPPVKTRNTWFVRAFEPLLHLLGLPKYRGLDPALFFAPFMMLFFGICLGDVGYGLSMLAASYIMKRLLGRKFPAIIPVVRLTALFGTATLVWGLVTGSIFGAWPLARDFIPLDVSYDKGDPLTLFRLSIALAILHLTLAFTLAAVGVRTLRERFLKLGSIGILIGGIMFVLKISVWWWVLAAGVAAVLVCSSDTRNPFKRLGAGLWNLYNHIGLLGDVMSYSRLFGLGVASAAIASVVNMLAGQTRDAVPGFGWVLAILVLVVGHLFNITIGIIGALVHPARLHAVEALPKFVSLIGEPYRPLANDEG